MRRALCGALMLVWAGAACGAATPGELAARQAQARKQQGELRARIETLQKEIDKQESTRRDAANQLRESESAISTINRRLDELARQKQHARDDLAKLAGRISEQTAKMGLRQAELADLLRAQYASGLSPWTALLSGDDPQKIGRDLSYLSYVSQAQARAVAALRQAIDDLLALQKAARARERELAGVETETADQKRQLENQKREREKVLERMQEQLRGQHAEAATLERNDKRLGSLIAGLDVEITRLAEEARKAEEKRREEVRKAEAARKAAQEQARELQRQRQAAQEAEKAAREAERRELNQEQARQARLQVEQAHARARAAEEAERRQAQAQAEQEPDAGQAAPPADSATHAQRPAQAGMSSSAEADAPVALAPEGGFPGLRKGLPRPAPGEVLGKFGAQRPDGGIWRGIVLQASEGDKVRVVAAGRVVYANWLQGFGNLMIVDHGHKYLSVYGYNQSLLRKVGEVLHAGDTIATVGATGGQVEPGLYFEIRHNGLPVNPLLWLAQ